MSKSRLPPAALPDLMARVETALACGQTTEAEALLIQAGAVAPRNFHIWNNLGVLCAKAKRYVDAERHFSRAARLNPDNVSTQANLARTLLALGRLDEAERCARKALRLAPNAAPAHKIAADIALRQGRPKTAIRHCEIALAHQPNWCEALNSLASGLKMDGRLSDSVAALRRSSAVRPNDTAARNLVMGLTYDPGCDDTTLRAAEQDYAALVERSIVPLPPVAIRSQDPAKQLTIGYLSADFREHPVARNVLGLLEHRDRQSFRVIAYAHVPIPDALSKRIGEFVDLWRPIAGLSDQAVAQQMRADGVDILVSLAGWTGDNRPAICGWRPAPLQISFHDLASSGLAAMDLWVSDPILHPEGTTEPFTERLLRLPCFYLHAEPIAAPAPGPLPAGMDGTLTFGSCNNPVKINDDVLDLWSAVLTAVPGSRLLLKYRTAFAEPEIRDRFAAAFAQRGIAQDRLVLAGGSDSRDRHLEIYHRIDIALDTWPFNGSTTNFEALFMGVPMLSLTGGRFVSRVGASLLYAIGLDELACETPDGFVAAAVALANDRARLTHMRQGLRERLRSSPLMDGLGYTRAWESALRDQWRAYCATG